MYVLYFELALEVRWWRLVRWTGRWVKLLHLGPFSKRESMLGSLDRFGLGYETSHYNFLIGICRMLREAPSLTATTFSITRLKIGDKLFQMLKLVFHNSLLLQVNAVIQKCLTC